jgi:hypothetical protein
MDAWRTRAHALVPPGYVFPGHSCASTPVQTRDAMSNHMIVTTSVMMVARGDCGIVLCTICECYIAPHSAVSVTADTGQSLSLLRACMDRRRALDRISIEGLYVHGVSCLVLSEPRHRQ